MDEFHLHNEPFSRNRKSGSHIIGRPRKQIVDGRYQCCKCKHWKEVSLFSSSSVSAVGLDAVCKACRVAMSNERISTNVESFLNRLAVTCGRKCKRSSARRNQMRASSEVTTMMLLELWKNQEGKCAISGVPMTHIGGQGRVMTNASVDRIDNSEGYTKGNVQLVCLAANRMKDSMSLTELKWWCQQVLAHE